MLKGASRNALCSLQVLRPFPDSACQEGASQEQGLRSGRKLCTQRTERPAAVLSLAPRGQTCRRGGRAPTEYATSAGC